MRISSLHIFNIANRGISDASQAITKTQEQLSSGKRVLSPSDDPIASAKIIQLEQELAGIEQFEKNISIAENNLVVEESTLGSVNNLLTRIKEVAVQAGNTATLSENEYNALAAEVDSRLDELLNLLNTQNANGDFVFGGYKSSEEPFTGDAVGGFRYNGDEGQQSIKIAENTSIVSVDSGKKIYGNTSNPPVSISVGQVVDQEVFDEFYPRDMIITFNDDRDITPPGKNFTVTERTTGNVIAENQSYLSGDFIELEGVRFRITGYPTSGQAADPATREFGADATVAFPVDFSAPGEETFDILVNGRRETFVLDANISSTTDLANALNSTVNGNAQKLEILGLTVDNGGFEMSDGANFSILNGSANIDSVMGLTSSAGSTSNDGVVAQPGDRLFIDSSNKQDILTTLASFSEAMKSYDGSEERREQLSTQVAMTLDNLNHAQTSILNTVSEIGARFNTLESTQSLHVETEFVISEILGEMRDVDYAEAATQLSAQSLILQAAQSSFVRVSQLNLFSQL